MAKNLKFGAGEDGETALDDLSGLLANVKNREALNNLEAQNNAKAYAAHLLFSSKQSKSSNLLSTAALCGIHKDMFGEVWAWAGEIKKGGQKNIGVPVIKIVPELHRLDFDFHKWQEEKMPVSEIAVRVHHRLVWIHPFENGNGRWARLVTNIYLRREDSPLIEWPSDPKLIRELFKPRYLAALKKADAGDYKLLTELHKEYTKS